MTFTCRVCGFQGAAVRYTPGSVIVEIALWLLCLIPGLFYSVWRLCARYTMCPKCHNRF